MAVAVAAAVVATFWPCLNNGFVEWDDVQNLLDNPHYRGLGAEQLGWMFTTYHMGVYQPLAWLMFGLEHVAFGERAWGFHLIGLLLHLLCALVFFDVTERLFGRSVSLRSAASKTAAVVGAGAATLAFAVHPLRVETVVWASGQPYLLCCLMYLLAVRSYLKIHAGRAAHAGWRRLAVCFGFGAVAMLSKGIAVSLPLVLVVLDVYPLRRLSLRPSTWRSRATRLALLEKVPFFLLALATAWVGVRATTFKTEVSELRDLSAFEKLTVAGHGLSFYLRKTVAPVGLSMFYALPADFRAGRPEYVIGGASFVLFAATLIALSGRWPAGAAALACYAAALAPVLGAVTHGSQVAADRYSLFSCMGWAVLFGAGVARALGKVGRRGRARLIVPLVVGLTATGGLALGWLSWRQTHVWGDSTTLWSHAMAVGPPNATLHYGLGSVLLKQERAAEALPHLDDAVRLKPDYLQAHFNRGIALARLGETERALEALREAIRINPRHADAHLNLGAVRVQRGELDQAVAAFHDALRADPRHPRAWRYLALVLFERGPVEAAIEAHRRALAVNPTDAELLANLRALQARRPGTDVRPNR